MEKCPGVFFKRQSVFVTDELAIGDENKCKKLVSLALCVCSVCAAGFYPELRGWLPADELQIDRPAVLDLPQRALDATLETKQIGKHNKARLALALFRVPWTQSYLN